MSCKIWLGLLVADFVLDFWCSYWLGGFQVRGAHAAAHQDAQHSETNGKGDVIIQRRRDRPSDARRRRNEVESRRQQSYRERPPGCRRRTWPRSRPNWNLCQATISSFKQIFLGDTSVLKTCFGVNQSNLLSPLYYRLRRYLWSFSSSLRKHSKLLGLHFWSGKSRTVTNQLKSATFKLL